MFLSLVLLALFLAAFPFLLYFAVMRKKLDAPPEGLQVHEVADLLGVTRRTIANWARSGKIPRGRHRWTPKEVDEMRQLLQLEGNKRGGGQ